MGGGVLKASGFGRLVVVDASAFHSLLD